MKASQGDVFRRREQLIELLRRQGSCTINDLAASFKVSAVTIRRDLLFLEKKKMVERYYGGVRLVNQRTPEQPLVNSPYLFPVKELVVAVQPALEDAQVVFVGSGYFSTELIFELSHFDLTIVTNDYSALLIEHPAKRAIVSICGGELEMGTHSLVGDFATLTFSRLQADLCLLEAAGVDPHEVTTGTLNESSIYRTMAHHTTGQKIVYTPAENINRTSHFMIDRTFMFDSLYTNRPLREGERAHFDAQGMRVFSL